MIANDGWSPAIARRHGQSRAFGYEMRGTAPAA
jgi:hypothetical protein